eukprot:scaffold1991_cov82-Phaeocystis_antarctica.AAC.2
MQLCHRESVVQFVKEVRCPYNTVCPFCYGRPLERVITLPGAPDGCACSCLTHPHAASPRGAGVRGLPAETLSLALSLTLTLTRCARTSS